MCHGPGLNLPNTSLQKIGMPDGESINTSSSRIMRGALTVAPIQRNSTHVEDSQNGRVRTKTDQVDGNAQDGRDPDCEDRGAGER